MPARAIDRIVYLHHTHSMSKRLQVVMSEIELKSYERAARSKDLPLSEWVRQALRAARSASPRPSGTPCP